MCIVHVHVYLHYCFRMVLVWSGVFSLMLVSLLSCQEPRKERLSLASHQKLQGKQTVTYIYIINVQSIDLTLHTYMYMYMYTVYALDAFFEGYRFSGCIIRWIEFCDFILNWNFSYPQTINLKNLFLRIATKSAKYIALKKRHPTVLNTLSSCTS